MAATWYNPASWGVFSDYGAAAWSEDIDAAVDQADSWIATTAAARSWHETVVAMAQAAVQTAAEGAGDDVIAFWSRLASLWDQAGYDGVDGWKKLGDTFASAGHAAVSTAEGREAGSLGGVLGGTAAGTGEDLSELAKWAKAYGPYVLGALLVVGVIAFAVSRR